MKKIKIEIKYLAVFSMLLACVFFVSFLIVNSINNYFDSLAVRILLMAILAIVFSVIISYGLSILSTTVKDAMITLRRMLTVQNLSNPLLMKLAEKAPGTYHHSMNVSNIAQNAARKIGANSLLVRTASYYHDIGKLKDPGTFIENQSHNEIPQDENAEYIRNIAKRIISHVTEGIKVAKDNSLPEEIIDLIAEHHGTTRVLYCFEKAKERGLKIKRTDFRYPGPVPQSPESVILMLADCVEAAARASENLSHATIKKIVESTIEEKLAEKQIGRANISETNLAKIKNSLIESLDAIYHQRIKLEQE
ncbi:MAG: HDIG domain-containing metalloprotein [Patescibacteria group bacterium]|jgi:hypothetical protein